MQTKLVCKEDRFFINLYEPSYPDGVELISLNAMGEVVAITTGDLNGT